MDRNFLRCSFVLLIMGISLLSGCSVPHLIWPQSDIQVAELNNPDLPRKILVASRSSEFKNALVAHIKEAFQDTPVYVKFIGIDKLALEPANEYTAVVLINTCMAWEIDTDVQNFLVRRKDQSSVILLTTSGDGDWLPDPEEYDVDALSSASQPDEIQPLADTIIEKLHAILQHRLT